MTDKTLLTDDIRRSFPAFVGGFVAPDDYHFSAWGHAPGRSPARMHAFHLYLDRAEPSRPWVWVATVVDRSGVPLGIANNDHYLTAASDALTFSRRRLVMDGDPEALAAFDHLFPSIPKDSP